MSELKPCPFCGSADIRTEPGINLNYCDKCSAEANIEHWNTRPIEDALNAELLELNDKAVFIKFENGTSYRLKLKTMFTAQCSSAATLTV